MARDQRPLPSSHRLRHVLGLALSGTALAALVYVETVSAHGGHDDAELLAELADELDASAEGSELAAMPEATASIPFAKASSKLAVETVQIEAAATEKQETEAPAIAMVVVPDLTGMRLHKARRELKALGLKMTVRDQWGEQVPRDWWGDYKVRSQKIEAGTEVQAGTRVRIKAKERYRPVMGY